MRRLIAAVLFGFILGGAMSGVAQQRVTTASAEESPVVGELDQAKYENLLLRRANVQKTIEVSQLQLDILNRAIASHLTALAKEGYEIDATTVKLSYKAKK